jgi:hypothetical protein
VGRHGRPERLDRFPEGGAELRRGPLRREELGRQAGVVGHRLVEGEGGGGEGHEGFGSREIAGPGCHRSSTSLCREGSVAAAEVVESPEVPDHLPGFFQAELEAPGHDRGARGDPGDEVAELIATIARGDQQAGAQGGVARQAGGAPQLVAKRPPLFGDADQEGVEPPVPRRPAGRAETVRSPPVVPLVVIVLLMAWTFRYSVGTRTRSRSEVVAAEAALAR